MSDIAAALSAIATSQAQMAQAFDRLADAIETQNYNYSKEKQAEDEPAIPLSHAWGLLGYPNASRLRHRIRTGHYRIGHEVEDRRTPGSARPSYYLKIRACRDRDKQQPHKRRA